MRYLKMILILLVVVPVIFLILYSHQSSLRYKDWPAPNIVAPSTKELIISLINTQEYFSGFVKLRFLDLERNKAEITMRNNSIADDSIGDTEYYILAEKKEPGWTVIQYKIHWKCARRLFLDFWTTNPCP